MKQHRLLHPVAPHTFDVSVDTAASYDNSIDCLQVLLAQYA
jgi:hypothetical protein